MTKMVTFALICLSLVGFSVPSNAKETNNDEYNSNTCTYNHGLRYQFGDHVPSVGKRLATIGLPNSIVVIHDLHLNLDEMTVPGLAPQLQPSGRLKGNLMFDASRRIVTVFIMQAEDLRIDSHVLAILNPRETLKRQTFKKREPKREIAIGVQSRSPVMHYFNLDDLTLPTLVSPPQPTGKLMVKLGFAENRRILTVSIIKVQDLRIAGQPDDSYKNAFVKAVMRPGKSYKYETKRKAKCKDTLFFEKFTIRGIVPWALTDESAIEFKVYSVSCDKRRYLVGVTSISLREIETLENGFKEMTIMPKSDYKLRQGDLRITGCFRPMAGDIVFHIKGARNFPVGVVGPYVAVNMYVNEVRQAKKKIRLRQNDPDYKHPCVFEIKRENPKYMFVFKVKHRNLMTGDMQELGRVSLGSQSDGETLDQLHDMMEHPHRFKTYCHPIMKTVKLVPRHMGNFLPRTDCGDIL